jgi:site-specific recombinase XerD
MLEDGVNILCCVQKLMGHADVKKIYTHVVEKDISAALGQLPTLAR